MSGAVDSEWIEWSGGECPVSAQALVHIRCRDGWDSDKMARSSLTKGGYLAGALRWSHETNYSDAGDILAYRVVQP